jgi:hypothetical protein
LHKVADVEGPNLGAGIGRCDIRLALDYLVRRAVTSALE